MTSNTANLPPIINVGELPSLLETGFIRKRILPISKTKLRELAADGEIETVKLGHQRLFVTASLASWIERSRAVTKQPAANVRTRRKAAAVPTTPFTKATTA